jgi:(p)ppGpp synthase/HD superfamily hydrolase
MNILEASTCLAVNAHKGQKRRNSNDEYITHPLRVSDMVIARGKSNVIAAAAVMHDVFEDTEYNQFMARDILLYDYSQYADEVSKVIELIIELTKIKNIYWEATNISFDAKFIKLCDRIDNLRDWKSQDIGWVKRYLKNSEHLLSQLHGVDKEYEDMLSNTIKNIYTEIANG